MTDSAGSRSSGRCEDLFGDASETENQSHIVSFRDLYNDEQIAREERLATAGNRLKERIASLNQQKQERRVVLDPRIGLIKNRNTRRPARPKLAANNRALRWTAKDYKPRSLAEKARIAASNIAHASKPIKVPSKSSLRLAVQRSLGTKPDPIYVDDALPEDCDSGKTIPKDNLNGTRFVERVVKVPAKSSIDRPFRLGRVLSSTVLDSLSLSPDDQAQIPSRKQPAIAKIEHSQSQITTTAFKRACNDASPEAPLPAVRKSVPGITRKPKPSKPRSASEEALQQQTMTTSPQKVSLPLHDHQTQTQDLQQAHSPPNGPASPPSAPSTLIPPVKRPSAPSIFIPRKRPKGP